MAHLSCGTNCMNIQSALLLTARASLVDFGYRFFHTVLTSLAFQRVMHHPAVSDVPDAWRVVSKRDNARRKLG